MIDSIKGAARGNPIEIPIMEQDLKFLLTSFRSLAYLVNTSASVWPLGVTTANVFDVGTSHPACFPIDTHAPEVPDPDVDGGPCS